MLAVVIEQLNKRYGETVALDQLTVAIGANQIFGFLGPDGAGKTTLFRILCGVLTADGGRVLVNGCDISLEPERIKQDLGYMPQKFALYSDLTVRENLDFFAELFNTRHSGLNRKKEELLELANLLQFQNRLAGNLSGGMKQKLALCCTLIHTPKLLILDEPTTGVDPVSRQEFWGMLTPLPALGTTVIVSTAYMDEAGKCDRIAMMNRGRILTTGTPVELKKPLQGKIFEIRGEKLFEIEELLRTSVKDLQIFGDRLHVQLKTGMAVDQGQAENWLKAILSENGYSVTVTPASPTLEDAYVEFLTDGGRTDVRS